MVMRRLQKGKGRLGVRVKEQCVWGGTEALRDGNVEGWGQRKVSERSQQNLHTSPPHPPRLEASFHFRKLLIFMILWHSTILRPDTDLLRRIWRVSMQCFWMTSWYSWGCRGNFPASNSAVRTNLRSLNLPKEREKHPKPRRCLIKNFVWWIQRKYIFHFSMSGDLNRVKLIISEKSESGGGVDSPQELLQGVEKLRSCYWAFLCVLLWVTHGEWDFDRLGIWLTRN